MKRLFALFSVLIIIIASMTVGLATVYAHNTQTQPTEIVLLKDIEEIRSGHDLSDVSERREVLKDILLSMGIDDEWAERFAQCAPERAVDGIVNAEEIGGITKSFSDGK